MNIKLYLIDKQLKILLSVYLIVITIGVSIGLVYLKTTTSMTPKGTVERFNGSNIESDQLDIPESYPKPVSELLLTTHNHILGLAFIFLSAGFIFYFNSIVNGVFKTVLMVEPLLSVIITFGSIWLIRFVDQAFVYLTFFSSLLMYLGFYTIVLINLFELLFRKGTIRHK
jgi:hypothetical protein